MAARNGQGVRAGDIVPGSWLPGQHFVLDANQRFVVGDFVIVTRADKRLGVGGVVWVTPPSPHLPFGELQLLATPRDTRPPHPAHAVQEQSPGVYDVMTSPESKDYPARVIKYRKAYPETANWACSMPMRFWGGHKGQS